MFVDQIRRAIEAAPRVGLPALSLALWKGHAAGAFSDNEAQALADLIEARKAVPTTPPAARRRIGSRPRSSESMERRRRWVASGWMPPQLASRFTLAELAVLSVVASEVTKRRGECRLTIGAIAALAGVCRSSVQQALRYAEAMGALTIEEWRIEAFRNAPNCIRIVSPEWRAWLTLAARRGMGGGSKTSYPTSTTHSERAEPIRESSGDRRLTSQGRPWTGKPPSRLPWHRRTMA